MYEPHPPLILIGFMAVGKSSLGRLLAKKLNYEFIDTDLWIENKYHKSIPELMQGGDETDFRKKERFVLEEVACIENAVIATGGGAPCSPGAMDILLSAGVVFYLQLDNELLAERVYKYRARRPSVAKLDPEAIRTFVQEKMHERAPYYERAHRIVDAKDLDNKEMIYKCAEELAEQYHAILRQQFNGKE